MRMWTLLLFVAFSSAAQTVVPVGHFESVALHSGGHVVVRQGATQRVTLISGDLRAARIGVREGRLVIHNAGRKHGRHERLRVEVVTPDLTAVSVSNGGTLEIADAFSAQATIAASVEQGGTIDIRPVAADSVVASVYSGGKIFTHPRRTLTASVRSGGNVTYWGNPLVTRSIRDGGVIVKGKPAHAGKPLSALDLGPNAIQPIKPIAPIH
ncbi:MAG TPA: DUF2807 domain-containing protein [Thermoanaerobaculia bacterium]|nr:DUF2807 domain-containing protein [Thermoanaerobaculia bacterium]